MKNIQLPFHPTSATFVFRQRWLAGVCLAVSLGLGSARGDIHHTADYPKWQPYAMKAVMLLMAGSQEAAADPQQGLQTLLLAQKFSRVAITDGGNDLVRENDRIIAQTIWEVEQLIKDPPKTSAEKNPAEYVRSNRAKTPAYQSNISVRTNIQHPTQQPGYSPSHS